MEVTQMTEQSGDEIPPMNDGPVLGKSDPVLKVDGMRKAFGGLVATDDASLEVERGTITGMIGPNGAGKSTLFNLVSGFYEPDAGSVTLRPERWDDDAEEWVIEEHDVSGTKPHKRVDSGMVRTFQTPRKPEGMTVREAMLVGPQNQIGESIFALFTNPEQVRMEESEALARADEMLDRFGIAHLAGEPATELSGGQMKLVELARAMMAEPDLLLLDEPVAGVNPTLANELREFIHSLNEDGVTFLVIEHDMSFIMRLADPIIVLDQGSVLGEGSPEAVRTDERVIDAYLGGAL
ncbi:Phosphonate-transporting ATPase [halophilic archaeon DL31]|nr:Phosphonate-transporting ATPase [halophilic archaeon DL31]